MTCALKLVNDLLQYHQAFQDVTAFEEAGLAAVDHTLGDRSQPRGVSLGADLEGDVDKSYRTVLLNRIGPLYFGNETDDAVVKARNVNRT